MFGFPFRGASLSSRGLSSAWARGAWRPPDSAGRLWPGPGGGQLLGVPTGLRRRGPGAAQGAGGSLGRAACGLDGAGPQGPVFWGGGGGEEITTTGSLTGR